MQRSTREIETGDKERSIVNMYKYGVIIALLLASTTLIGQALVGVMAPIHEFGHYITAKSFGWDIIDVDWYSYVKYSEETVTNAPRLQIAMVSIAGMIFMPILPYILVLLIKRRSVIRDIITIPYFVLGILASGSDLRKVVWGLLTIIPIPWMNIDVLDLNSIIVSIITVIIMAYILNTTSVRYSQCINKVYTVIAESEYVSR